MVKVVNNIEELIQGIQIIKDAFDQPIWYRGQANSTWGLVPGLYRLLNTDLTESILFKRFKQNSSLLLNTAPGNYFEWLFLMQHYGLPTRLLDWTEAPLVALYFAIENPAFDDVDATLWVLFPADLNKKANVHHSPDDIPSFDDDHLINYNLETITSQPNLKFSPMATIAARNNIRIQAQQGVFTIHQSTKECISSHLTEPNGLDKFIIPANAKAQLRKQLNLLNITRFQLFPELDSINKHILGA